MNCIAGADYLAASPAIFQGMDMVLHGLNHVVWYLDDILVSEENDEQHLKNFTLVLDQGMRDIILLLTCINQAFNNYYSLVHTILHQSMVIQDNSVGVLFNGLLAKLPARLDSSFHQCHAHDRLHRDGWSGVLGSTGKTHTV